VGIGRSIRTATDPAVAEIALEVVDACQGLGLGRLLFEVIGAAAADIGITPFQWLVDEANYRVRRLAERLCQRTDLDHSPQAAMQSCGTRVIPPHRLPDLRRHER
jgi:GNAT superfamily N-acetyltransferase